MHLCSFMFILIAIAIPSYRNSIRTCLQILDSSKMVHRIHVQQYCTTPGLPTSTSGSQQNHFNPCPHGIVFFLQERRRGTAARTKEAQGDQIAACGQDARRERTGRVPAEAGMKPVVPAKASAAVAAISSATDVRSIFTSVFESRNAASS